MLVKNVVAAVVVVVMDLGDRRCWEEVEVGVVTMADNVVVKTSDCDGGSNSNNNYYIKLTLN